MTSSAPRDTARHSPSGRERPQAAAPKRVAYLMSRFPTINETFILLEILELERRGLQIDIFPLLRQHEAVVHAEAAALMPRVHYARLGPLLAAQWHWIRRRPRAYLLAWLRALAGNAATPSFLARTVAVVPCAALAAREAEALGVEHVHAHWATHPALAAYVMHLLTGRPYSVTAHAHDLYEARPMLEEKLGRASFVVTISRYNLRLLRELYGAAVADKTAVIHCGVDTDDFQAQPPTSARDFTIVCVASLRDYKGHPFLLDACAALATQGVAFRCLLVGEGPDRAAIEGRIAELGLGHRITLLGHQPRARVRELVAAADVVVLPSVTTATGKKEGIPVALMEALACERPVVATALSGVPELVEHEGTGLLVPERSAAALADALLRLEREPELCRRLGAAGRAKVLREFDIRACAAQLDRLLRRDWAIDSRTARPDGSAATTSDRQVTEQRSSPL